MNVDKSVDKRIQQALSEGRPVVVIRGPKGSFKASPDVVVIEA